jgi:hypothetical protein
MIANNHVICINAFVKIDDTFHLLNLLNKCIGKEKYDILISVDSTKNMPYTDRDHWHAQNRELTIKLLDYSRSDEHNFASVEIISFGVNHHPYKACKKIIDIGMQRSDYVIFLEDDCCVSRDYLLYHEYMYSNFASNNPQVSAIIGSYYNAHSSREPSQEDINKVNKAQWVTSYEMGICKRVWEQFGDRRGLEPEGDIYFAEDLKQAGLHTLYPEIARCYRHVFQKDAYSNYYAPDKVKSPIFPLMSDNSKPLVFEVL